MTEVNNKLFTEQQGIREINFKDLTGEVTLWPGEKRVSAIFKQPGHLADLPIDYEFYKKIDVSDMEVEDYQEMFKWTLAKYIDIRDTTDLADKVMKAARRLVDLTQLETLRFTYDKEKYKNLLASWFFINQSNLKTVTFYSRGPYDQADSDRLTTIAKNQRMRGFAVDTHSRYMLVTITRAKKKDRKKKGVLRV